MTPFPLMLLAEGRPCLVIGAGDVADAKTRLAQHYGLAVKSVAKDADRQTIPPTQSGLAFVALTDALLAASWAAALKDKGYLVNVADQPQLCDFILPAIVDRAPVIIAISTGGGSATMARQIRTRLEADLPEQLGAMVSFISTVRADVAQLLPSAEERRHFWDWATTDGGLCDPFAQDRPPSAEQLLAAARQFSAQTDHRQKRITIIQLHSLDPADITLRALRRLQQADQVLCLGTAQDMSAVAMLARRDAVISYEEISELSDEKLIKYLRSVILAAPGIDVSPPLLADARLEWIVAGKAEL